MTALASLLVCALTLQEAPKPRDIALPYEWKVGTTFALSSERSEEHFEGEKRLRSSASRTPMTLEVIARREDGYTMRWTFGKAELIASSEPPAPSIRILASLLDGLVLDVVTDPGGTPLRVADPLGVDAQLAKLAQAMHDALIAAGTPPEDARYVLVHAESSKGPTFHANLLRGPTLFLMACGAKLTVGDRKHWDDQLPNPFGGAPLPSRSQLWLASVDDAKNEAVIEWRNSVDAVRGKSAIEASIRAASKRTGRELPENAVFDLQAIEDAASTTFDLATGWPKTMVYTRTSKMFDVRRVDSVRMEARPLEVK